MQWNDEICGWILWATAIKGDCKALNDGPFWTCGANISEVHRIFAGRIYCCTAGNRGFPWFGIDHEKIENSWVNKHFEKKFILWFAFEVKFIRWKRKGESRRKERRKNENGRKERKGKMWRRYSASPGVTKQTACYFVNVIHQFTLKTLLLLLASVKFCRWTLFDPIWCGTSLPDQTLLGEMSVEVFDYLETEREVTMGRRRFFLKGWV